MFTLENTEGFTKTELIIMNDVLDELMSDCDPSDIDSYNQWEHAVSDAINNSYIKGVAFADLLKYTKQHLGI